MLIDSYFHKKEKLCQNIKLSFIFLNENIFKTRLAASNSNSTVHPVIKKVIAYICDNKSFMIVLVPKYNKIKMCNLKINGNSIN